MITNSIIKRLKFSKRNFSSSFINSKSSSNIINSYKVPYTHSLHKNFSTSSNQNFPKDPIIFKETNLKGYINYIRKHGYKSAKIDPLNLREIFKNQKDFNSHQRHDIENTENKNIEDSPDDIEVENEKMSSYEENFQPHAWELGELEKLEEFPIDNSSTFNPTLLDSNTTISDLQKYLNKLYLSSVGVEFEHIESESEKTFLYETYENIMSQSVNNMELVNAFKMLYPADLFEKFLHNKYPTFKRYSGEGANTLLVLLYSMLSECSKNSSQVTNAILSMPHRGRLNILPMILDYPVANLLSKINGKRDMPKEIEGIDDVVSHVAVSNQKTFCLSGSLKDYKPINISMLHNPSHLEAIYPVAMGKTLAKGLDNKNLDSVINITIHGDSAVSGQGVIYESLSFHRSPNCNLHGTVHIVTNNQIGYTTLGQFSRSSLNCTDIFKSYNIPIIHVNADDCESLIKIGRLAYEYKMKFKKDIAINFVCWRKYGHNEVDEPRFTQPLMYKVIKEKKESVENLKKYLVENNLITDESVKTLEERYNKILNDEFIRAQSLELKLEDVKNEKSKGNKAFTNKWKEMDFAQFCQPDSEIKTGLNSIEEAKSILKSSVTLPSDFKIHPRLNQYFVNNRLQMIEKGVIDWPSAEMLAFGSLLKEGYNVRISGQDVTRGTFSQRHIGLFDQETNRVYFPFKDRKNFNSNGRLEVSNSSLSEMAVMLFEYGYSWENPKNCVIWEAQFGDFVNGAQITQDQFIVSGEKKWMRQSGLILLLPHGFDGTGPEHSSAKIERFLQLTDSSGIDPLYDTAKLPDHRKLNICVVQPTKPSNYFHLLRRQMLRKFRKPMIVVAPKIGLKHAAYTSNLSEFSLDSKFQPIVVDSYGNENNTILNLSQLRGVIFCSGQIFIELKKHAEELIKQNKKVNYITIRIEEIAPFPEKEIMNKLNSLSTDAKFYYIQEESMNVGAYTYASPHLRRILKNLNIKDKEVYYIGREAQVGANGCVNDHKSESNKLSQDIMNLFSN